MDVFINYRDRAECEDCGFCKYFLACSRPCTGCGACVIACPNAAIKLEKRIEKSKLIEIVIDGECREVPENITVLKALEFCGYKISHTHHSEGNIFAPCNTGGCWACAVLVNDEIKPSCVTPVKRGIKINTNPAAIAERPPRRPIKHLLGSPHGSPEMPPYSHQSIDDVEELSCLMHGCNLHCPVCHNWNLTFSCTGDILVPHELINDIERISTLKWISISGGEPTLNRRWLTEFLMLMKKRMPHIRIHLDTNGTVLTEDYMEELNHLIRYISVDLKSAGSDAYMKISGLEDRETAEVFLKNSWYALEYLIKNCHNIFTVALIPFHPELVPIQEIESIAGRLAAIHPEIPVTLLEYHAAFRKRNLRKITTDELKEAYYVLKRYLSNVQVQFSDALPEPVDPRFVLLSNG